MGCKGLLGEVEVIGGKISALNYTLISTSTPQGSSSFMRGVDRLGVRAVDVDETLVGRYFELLTALLVDEVERLTVKMRLRVGGDRTAHDGAGSFHVRNDLFCRFLNERVVIALEFDADLLTHLLFELNFALRQWDKSRSLSHRA